MGGVGAGLVIFYFIVAAIFRRIRAKGPGVSGDKPCNHSGNLLAVWFIMLAGRLFRPSQRR